MDEQYRRHVPAISFALALLVAGFTGCGKQESTKPAPADPATTGRLLVKSNRTSATVDADRIPAAGATKPVSAKGTVGQPLAGLPPGKYTVIVHTDGWPDLSQEADLRAGQVTEVSADFKSGSLRVDSDPAGAAVRIGTDVLGRTPLAVPQLPPGDCQLVVEYPGWPAVTIKTTIVENQEAAHSVHLPYGKVVLESYPAGAAVVVGGRSLGQTPLTLERVAAGPRKFTLQAKDFPPVEVAVTVEDGGEVRVSRSLASGYPVVDPAALLAAVWVDAPKEDSERLSPAFTDATGYRSQNGIVKNLNRKQLFEKWLGRNYCFAGTVKSYNPETGQVEFAEQKTELCRFRVFAKLSPAARADKEVVAQLTKDATFALYGKLTAVEEPAWPAKFISVEFSSAQQLRGGVPPAK